MKRTEGERPEIGERRSGERFPGRCTAAAGGSHTTVVVKIIQFNKIDERRL